MNSPLAKSIPLIPIRSRVSLLTAVGAYPTIVLLLSIINPLMGDASIFLKAGILVPLMVCLLTYVVMPFLSSIFHNWLFGIHKPREEQEKEEFKENVNQASKPNRKFKRSTLMSIRRIHLYAGLFMLPWVLLYGISGFFFNHPMMFTSDQTTSFSAIDNSKEASSVFPGPSKMAQMVVNKLNDDRKKNEHPEVKLSDSSSPFFRDYLAYKVIHKNQSHIVKVSPISGQGEIRTTFTKPSKETTKPKYNPIEAIPNIKVENNPYRNIRNELPRILKEQNLEPGKISSHGHARLIFAATVKGENYTVTYHLPSQQITSTRDDNRKQINTKSFLQRLHLSRAYSPGFDTRFFWALLVDTMVVAMIFWSLSGVVMWWQVKRTRRWGAVVILFSLVLTFILVSGMHDQLTNKSDVNKGKLFAKKAADKAKG